LKPCWAKTPAEDDVARSATWRKMIFRIFLEDQYAQKSKEAKAVEPALHAAALALGRRGQGRTCPILPSAPSW